MRRASPRAVWYAFEGGASLYGALVFTFTAIYFVRELDASPLQLVLVGTVMELAYFLFEVPTGALADSYSRRASVVVGVALQGLASIIVGAIAWFPAVLAGYALWGFGATFISGAAYAWITDEVGAERVGGLLLRGERIGWALAIVGVGIGVGLATIDLRVPIVAGGALMVALAVYLALFMPERPFRAEGEERRGPVALARAGGTLVRRSPLLVLVIGIAALWGASSESFDRLWEAHLLTEIGLPDVGAGVVVWFGILGVASMVVSLLVSTRLIGRLEQLDDAGMARVLLGFTVGLLASLVLFALAFGFWVAAIAYLAVRFVRSMVNPLYMTWLNRQIHDSSVRATVLSIMGQGDAVGQFTGGPAIGFAGNAFGIRAALVAGAALLGPAAWFYGRAVAHHGREPELEQAAAPAGTG